MKWFSRKPHAKADQEALDELAQLSREARFLARRLTEVTVKLRLEQTREEAP